jgi:hypothetical protein
MPGRSLRDRLGFESHRPPQFSILGERALAHDRVALREALPQPFCPGNESGPLRPNPK